MLQILCHNEFKCGRHFWILMIGGINVGIFHVGDFIFVVITFIIVIAIAVALVYFGVKAYKAFMRHGQ